MWRINKKEYIKIHTYSRKERIDLFKELRESRAKIECMCKLNVQGYPELHIRKTRKGYFPINNPGNRANYLRHANDCKFNHSYVDYLVKNGVFLEEDGTISCTLEATTNKRGKLETILRTMFLNILATYRIDEYRVHENRAVDKRLYHAFCEYVHLNNMIGPGHFYIVHKNFSYFWKKHMLVIGWIKRDEIEENGFFMDIPMYTLSEQPEFKYVHRVPVYVYERSASLQGKQDDSQEGFMIIYRDFDRKRKLREQSVLFIPAHTATKIPLTHPDEKLLLDHLVRNNIPFRKNMQPDLDEHSISLELLTRPVVLDVAEDTNENNIELKREYYEKEQKRYIAWNKGSKFPTIT